MLVFSGIIMTQVNKKCAEQVTISLSMDSKIRLGWLRNSIFMNRRGSIKAAIYILALEQLVRRKHFLS